MGWTTDLLTGVAEHLAAADAGTWRLTGVYQPAETGILIRAVPAQPDRIITLAAYPVEDPPGIADVTVGVQIRLRGLKAPTDCDDLADDVYNALHGLTHVVLGGVHVVQAYRQSHSSLGTDKNGRWERSENYYFDAMRPTAHNTD